MYTCNEEKYSRIIRTLIKLAVVAREQPKFKDGPQCELDEKYIRRYSSIGSLQDIPAKEKDETLKDNNEEGLKRKKSTRSLRKNDSDEETKTRSIESLKREGVTLLSHIY